MQYLFSEKVMDFQEKVQLQVKAESFQPKFPGICQALQPNLFSNE